MPHYSFTFKKDDVEIEIKTTDLKFICGVSDKWLDDICNSGQDNEKFKITVQSESTESKSNKLEPEIDLPKQQSLKVEAETSRYGLKHYRNS